MNKINELNKDLLIKQFNEIKVETINDLENFINYFKIKIKEINNPFLEKDIDDIDLSVRAFNAIMNYLKDKGFDIHKEMPKVKHIIDIKKQDFIKTKCVGAKSIYEIESIFNANGYFFKD